MTAPGPEAETLVELGCGGGGTLLDRGPSGGALGVPGQEGAVSGVGTSLGPVCPPSLLFPGPCPSIIPPYLPLKGQEEGQSTGQGSGAWV